jgi:hypothetical protein
MGSKSAPLNINIDLSMPMHSFFKLFDEKQRSQKEMETSKTNTFL